MNLDDCVPAMLAAAGPDALWLLGMHLLVSVCVALALVLPRRSRGLLVAFAILVGGPAFLVAPPPVMPTKDWVCTASSVSTDLLPAGMGPARRAR